jgi:hypothetical protein
MKAARFSNGRFAAICYTEANCCSGNVMRWIYSTDRTSDGAELKAGTNPGSAADIASPITSPIRQAGVMAGAPNFSARNDVNRDTRPSIEWA